MHRCDETPGTLVVLNLIKTRRGILLMFDTDIAGD